VFSKKYDNKFKIMKKIVAAILIFLINPCLFAQSNKETDADKKTDWWGDIDGFLNQQARVTLDLVNDALRANPPALQENMTRKMALIMIDNVLHEEKAQYRQAVQAFYKERIENAIGEIRTTTVNKGAVIWKLYNHTFIVKTPSVTIGFDIQRGIPGNENFAFSKELIRTLIDAVDVLFVTHYHGDHADEWVAATFIEQNKTVITPPGIWENLPLYNKVLHPERTTARKQGISLPKKQTSLEVVVCPGHQGEKILNNVYLVFTPEGMCFCHTGDQSYNEDLYWIDKIGNNYKIDVLMINSWSYYPEFRLEKGFRPALIIPGHENELNHSIDHREPYWLNNVRLGDDPSYPWIQMAAGENFHYFPVVK
jgi:L-ascorbate metabolism protein UlaG (beta-lactamase superfamily)